MTISTATRYVVIVIHRLSPLRTYRHMSVPVDQCLHHTVVWVKEPHTHLVPVPIPFVGPASTAALSQMRTCCGTMHWQWLDSFVLFAGQASRSPVPTQADPPTLAVHLCVNLCIQIWKISDLWFVPAERRTQIGGERRQSHREYGSSGCTELVIPWSVVIER